MNLIVAVDQNWGIGLNDELLFRIKADHRHFRELTIGNTVILGRKTLLTFPRGLPLKDRTNLILSAQENYAIEGAIVFHSISALLKQIETQSDGEIFVIGGASVYEALLPFCTRAYITKILSDRPADRYFPNLDLSDSWRIIEASPIQTEEDLDFQFLIYEKND